MLGSAICLGIAIASIWIPPLRFSSGLQLAWWPLFLVIAIAFGLYGGTITPTGAVIVVSTCLVAAAKSWFSVGWLRRASAIAGILLAFGLAVRLFPGFPQVVLVEGIRLSPDAIPMRVTAHFDAGVASLVLMALYCQPSRTWVDVKAAMVPTVAISAITTSLVIALSCAVGYVQPELKLPSFTFWHLAKVLLWTCVMEEALFRGVLQVGLENSSFIQSRPRLHSLPLIVASALFGLAHAPGGPVYVALAVLAGFGYGYALRATGRIEAAIFAHFILNMTHFIGFTYPSIYRG